MASGRSGATAADGANADLTTLPDLRYYQRAQQVKERTSEITGAADRLRQLT